MRIHYRNRTVVRGFDNPPTCQFKDGLKGIMQGSLFVFIGARVIVAAVIVAQPVAQTLGVLFLART